MGAIVFLLGLIIGSFLNVCIYRIPKSRSIAYPPSHCPECGTSLRWRDLVPVLSFLFLSGRCRYCGEEISPQYPTVEILNGLLYLALFYWLGMSIYFVFHAIIFSILIVISIIDLNHQIIPDSLNLLILVLGIIFKAIQFYLHTEYFNIIDSLLGLVIPGTIFLLIMLISKGGMGGGDMKLIGALGFILGIRKALLTMFLSFFLGALISLMLILLKIRNRKDLIPFGPFISLAFIITTFWGDFILFQYSTMFL